MYLTLFVLVLQLTRWETWPSDEYVKMLVPVLFAAVVEFGKFNILKYTIWGIYGIVFIILFTGLFVLHTKIHVEDTLALMSKLS